MRSGWPKEAFHTETSPVMKGLSQNQESGNLCRSSDFTEFHFKDCSIAESLQPRAFYHQLMLGFANCITPEGHTYTGEFTSWLILSTTNFSLHGLRGAVLQTLRILYSLGPFHVWIMDKYLNLLYNSAHKKADSLHSYTFLHIQFLLTVKQVILCSLP